MFEKIGRLAETAATRVAMSRRRFLGRLGQSALAVAGVVGVLISAAPPALAAAGVKCCGSANMHCKPPIAGCLLFSVSGCGTASATCVWNCNDGLNTEYSACVQG